MESPFQVLTRTAYGLLSSGAITAGGPPPTQQRQPWLRRIRVPRIRLRRHRAR